jgi:N-acetylneuraminic acid mutarotase
MLLARGWCASAVYNDKVIMFGGASPGNKNGITTVESYDPETGIWESLASMPTARYGAVAELINGRIYVAGGTVQEGDIDILEIYDPALDVWYNGTPMPTPRGQAAAGVVNGKLYVIGGYTPIEESPWYEACSMLEIYDPATGSWTSGRPMPTPRAEAVCGVIDNKLYVVGGLLSDDRTATGILEIYDPVDDTWSTGPLMRTARAEAVAGVIGGKLYVAGGY